VSQNKFCIWCLQYQNRPKAELVLSFCKPTTLGRLTTDALKLSDQTGHSLKTRFFRIKQMLTGRLRATVTCAFLHPSFIRLLPPSRLSPGSNIQFQ